MATIDNSVRKNLHYSRKAEKNVEAYSSAFRKQVSRELGTKMVLLFIGKLFWYCIFYPALYLLHFVFQFALSKITNTEFKNKHLRNPLN